MPINISLAQLKIPQGVILYDGPSRIDGKRIVAIATSIAGSNNPKTGDTIQTYILPAEINPYSAIWEGKDKSVCGDCKHASVKSGGMGTCYVNVAQGPFAVWKAWKNGNYDKPSINHLALFSNRVVRLGSYGDPVAVPIEVWDTILEGAKNHLGYTHQWEKAFAQPYKKYCMASADSRQEYVRAKLLGWRTFRVRFTDDALMRGEFACPASIEMGNKLTCEKCGACNGVKDFQNPITVGSPSIIVHGRDFKVRRFQLVMQRKEKKKGWKDLMPQRQIVKK
jgi:hypothetical protein